MTDDARPTADAGHRGNHKNYGKYSEDNNPLSCCQLRQVLVAEDELNEFQTQVKCKQEDYDGPISLT